LAARGAQDLAYAIDRLDPYVVTLDELKAQIMALDPSSARGGAGQ
jgi:hypothetical protein